MTVRSICTENFCFCPEKC